MTNVGVVTPPDSGLGRRHSRTEQMMSLASQTRQVTAIQPEEVALRKALAGGALDVIISRDTASPARPVLIAARSGWRLAAGYARMISAAS